MRFTVIGHMCLDVIHHPDGSETESYGGIFYAVAALANLASSKEVVHPVCGVGEKEYDDVKRRLSQYPNIDTTAIFPFSGEMNHVHLYYTGERRTECSKYISAPIPIERIAPYLSVAGIFIDMISGSDITLQTLDQIRLATRSKNTPIHLDLHSLTLGIDPDATRFRRPLTDWRRWCFMMNSVQMNEEEAGGLSVEGFGEEALAKQMLPLMVNAFCLTRGERGVTLFQQDHKKLVRNDIAGIAIRGAADPTGCGDVFGSAFLYAFCHTRKVLEAAEFANRVAAANAGLSGPDEINKLSAYKAA